MRNLLTSIGVFLWGTIGSCFAGPAVLTHSVDGSGFPILFSNGTGLDSRMWNAQTDALAAVFTVIRFDAPGTGETPLPRGLYDLRKSMRHLLDDLGFDAVCIVGQSGGSAVALDFALTYPAAVRALVLVSSGIGGSTLIQPDIDRIGPIAALARSEGHAAAVARMLDDPLIRPAAQDANLKEEIEVILLENPGLFSPAAFLRSVPLSRRAITRLEDVAAPTLVIDGDLDLSHIRQMSDTLVARLPNARRVTVEGAGHLLNMEKPAEFNTHVREFLAEECS